jgi:hypothetical protein
MNRRSLLGMGPAAVAFAALGLSGCTRPIYNVSQHPFLQPGTIDNRTAQIQLAAAGLGWETQVVRPGVIRATLHLRTHVAVTEITYNEQVFSIIYVDSTNLQYDGTSIHKNYNGWIQNLERAISVQPTV